MKNFLTGFTGLLGFLFCHFPEENDKTSAPEAHTCASQLRNFGVEISDYAV